MTQTTDRDGRTIREDDIVVYECMTWTVVRVFNGGQGRDGLALTRGTEGCRVYADRVRKA